ncbi:integrase, catalytic region, zinc finger, CCHC-type containing protein [Tanacetum coccineum]
MKDKVLPNTSQVKFKKTEVEDHPRISRISKQTKSVTACNDSLNSRTSNVNAVCATCGKYVFNSNHDACVSKFLNDVNARTKSQYLVQGNITINRVYYVEGLNHNLFSVSQFCDADLEDETPKVLKDFLTMIQRNLQAPVISVRTDRGTEFLNKTLNAFFKEEGIENQTSTPRTPEQNGVVKNDNPLLFDSCSQRSFSFLNIPFNEIKEMSETSVSNLTLHGLRSPNDKRHQINDNT